VKVNHLKLKAERLKRLKSRQQFCDLIPLNKDNYIKYENWANMVKKINLEKAVDLINYLPILLKWEFKKRRIKEFKVEDFII